MSAGELRILASKLDGEKVALLLDRVDALTKATDAVLHKLDTNEVVTGHDVEIARRWLEYTRREAGLPQLDG